MQVEDQATSEAKNGEGLHFQFMSRVRQRFPLYFKNCYPARGESNMSTYQVQRTGESVAQSQLTKPQTVNAKSHEFNDAQVVMSTSMKTNVRTATTTTTTT